MMLTEFLLARSADDEAAARRLLRYAQENELAVGEPQMLGRRIPGWHEWPDVQAMCSRVLTECEAKRRIVEQSLDGADNPVDYVALGLNQAVRLLAATYSDHPDYDEAWRA